MQNFDPKEYIGWKGRCAEQRSLARCNPCTDSIMATCVDFEVKVGPWNLRLYLAKWAEPHLWVGSISYFKHIGDETIYDKRTDLPIFEAPQDALLCVKDWTHEEKDIARSLLADLYGPLIYDKDTPMRETEGVFGLNWALEEKYARRAAAVGN